MSGTSADGVDAVLVRVEGQGLAISARVVKAAHEPFDRALALAIHQLRSAPTATLRQIASVTREVTLAYARAARRVMPTETDVRAIAAHGQTLFHDPPLTTQVLDPSLLSIETGCAVVSDFRRADCAVGGQGAPLVPLADYVLLRDASRDRVLVNLGGIANLTRLRAGCGLDDVIAFDTGPANCIGDALCRRLDPTGPGYDAAGDLASRGRVIEPLVSDVLAIDYFTRPHPKSTDGPAMIAPFDDAVRRLAPGASLADQLASANAIAARAIDASLDRLNLAPSYDVIASGGGTHNRHLMHELRTRITPRGAKLMTSDDLAIASSTKEALAFAILGAMTLNGLPGNVPSVTGATRPVVLGSVTHAHA